RTFVASAWMSPGRSSCSTEATLPARPVHCAGRLSRVSWLIITWGPSALGQGVGPAATLSPARHVSQPIKRLRLVLRMPSRQLACLHWTVGAWRVKSIYESYGRFPGGMDAMHLMWFIQVHHIGTDFYGTDDPGVGQRSPDPWSKVSTGRRRVSSVGTIW